MKYDDLETMEKQWQNLQEQISDSKKGIEIGKTRKDRGLEIYYSNKLATQRAKAGKLASILCWDNPND